MSGTRFLVVWQTAAGDLREVRLYKPRGGKLKDRLDAVKRSPNTPIRGLYALWFAGCWRVYDMGSTPIGTEIKAFAKREQLEMWLIMTRAA